MVDVGVLIAPAGRLIGTYMNSNPMANRWAVRTRIERESSPKLMQAGRWLDKIHFATGATWRKSMRAMELYSKPVNLGLKMVASVFQ